MYQKVRCTCKVVVLRTKSIVVLDVLVAVGSSNRKVPIKAQQKTVKVQDVIAYACCQSMILGDNQTVINNFPVI